MPYSPIPVNKLKKLGSTWYAHQNRKHHPNASGDSFISSTDGNIWNQTQLPVTGGTILGIVGDNNSQLIFHAQGDANSVTKVFKSNNHTNFSEIGTSYGPIHADVYEMSSTGKIFAYSEDFNRRISIGVDEGINFRYPKTVYFGDEGRFIFVNGKYWRLTSTNGIYSSLDGVTWDLISHITFEYDKSYGIEFSVANNRFFLYYRDQSNVYKLTSTTDFIEYTTPFNITIDSNVIWDDTESRYIVAGPRNTSGQLFWGSTDAINWTQIAASNFGGYSILKRFFKAGEYFYALGDDAFLYRSTNLLNWESRNRSYDVAYNGEALLSITKVSTDTQYGEVKYSYDFGTTWQTTTIEAKTFYGITALNGYFLVAPRNATVSTERILLETGNGTVATTSFFIPSKRYAVADGDPVISAPSSIIDICHGTTLKFLLNYYGQIYTVTRDVTNNITQWQQDDSWLTYDITKNRPSLNGNVNIVCLNDKVIISDIAKYTISNDFGDTWSNSIPLPNITGDVRAVDIIHDGQQFILGIIDENAFITLFTSSDLITWTEIIHDLNNSVYTSSTRIKLDYNGHYYILETGEDIYPQFFISRDLVAWDQILLNSMSLTSNWNLVNLSETNVREFSPITYTNGYLVGRDTATRDGSLTFVSDFESGIQDAGIETTYNIHQVGSVILALYSSGQNWVVNKSTDLQTWDTITLLADTSIYTMYVVANNIIAFVGLDGDNSALKFKTFDLDGNLLGEVSVLSGEELANFNNLLDIFFVNNTWLIFYNTFSETTPTRVLSSTNGTTWTDTGFLYSYFYNTAMSVLPQPVILGGLEGVSTLVTTSNGTDWTDIAIPSGILLSGSSNIYTAYNTTLNEYVVVIGFYDEGYEPRYEILSGPLNELTTKVGPATETVPDIYDTPVPYSLLNYFILKYPTTSKLYRTSDFNSYQEISFDTLRGYVVGGADQFHNVGKAITYKSDKNTFSTIVLVYDSTPQNHEEGY